MALVVIHFNSKWFRIVRACQCPNYFSSSWFFRTAVCWCKYLIGGGTASISARRTHLGVETCGTSSNNKSCPRFAGFLSRARAISRSWCGGGKQAANAAIKHNTSAALRRTTPLGHATLALEGGLEGGLVGGRAKTSRLSASYNALLLLSAASAVFPGRSTIIHAGSSSSSAVDEAGKGCGASSGAVFPIRTNQLL
jgi:hypothetical protein